VDHPEDSQPEDHGRGGTGVCQTEVGSA